MYKPILLVGLALGLIAFSAGCDIFDPQSSKATIEISNTYNPGGTACTVNVNLDGGSNVTVSNGSVYTFPLQSAGSHTVNFSFATNICSSATCTLSQNSVTFQANGGDLYVIKIAQGAACNNLVISGP